MYIKTKRLILRPWTINDLADYYEFAKVNGVNEGAGQNHFESIDQALMRLLGFTLNPNVLAIVYNQKVIGVFEINPSRIDYHPTYNKEIGFILSKDYWGQGLMKEAINGVLIYLKHNSKVKEVYAGYFYYNERSKKTLESLGFQYDSIHYLKYPILDDQPIKTIYLKINLTDYQEI